MSIIKKRTIVDESIFGDGTSDPFRLLNKSNWHNKSDEDVDINTLRFGGTRANRVDASMIKTVEVGEITETSDDLWYSYSCPVRIVGDASKIKNDGHWKTMISDNMNAGISYIDHAFSIDIPLTEKESEAVGASSHAAVGNINLYYNYYQKQYEEAIYNDLYQETVLPNLYAFVSAMNPNVETNRAFADLITLNGSLSESFIYALNEDGEKTSFYERGGYLYKYAVDGAPTHAQAAEVLSQRFKHMFVPYNQVDYLSDAEVFKFYFPMYTEITLQTDTNTLFADALKESGIACSFMKDMFESLFDMGGSMSTSELNFVEHNQYPSLDVDDENNLFYIQSELLETNSRRMIGVADWWQNTYGSNGADFGEEGVFIGSLSNPVKMAISDELPFYRNLNYLVLAGYLRGHFRDQIRSFDQIMNGDLAYSETLMYRISKFSGTVDDTTDADPIQTFWLPNSSDIDVIDFIDTQVKHGSEYTYVVYAYQAVMGVEYEYSDLAISQTTSEYPQICVELLDQTTGEMIETRFEGGDALVQNPNYSGIYEVSVGNQYTAEFNVTYKPSFQMIEVPLLSHSGKMIDNPPLSPEVDVVPYVGIPNKLRFFLSGRIGEEEHDEIVFDDFDEQNYSDIRTARGLHTLEQITFKSDDYPYQYEIYKTKTRPKSYDDFSNSLAARVESIISEDFETRYATAVAYEDSLVPNTKYYYIFRSVDIHGNSSHPSPVYQIEMVDDGASVYPIVDIIEFTEASTKTPTKHGRKFLHIVPNIRHRLINEDESGFEDYESASDLGGQMIIGEADDPVWDNKFKIRLTSKKTGRKIDLNLQFGTKHIVTDIEKN